MKTGNDNYKTKYKKNIKNQKKNGKKINGRRN